MISLILSTATRFLMPLMLLFSLFLLLRGHHQPGGGFAAGLVAAAAFALYAIAHNVGAARQILRLDPRILIGLGLLLAGGSGLVSLLVNLPYLTGRWVIFHVPLLGKAELGTPLIFDGGVYLVVTGAVLTIIFSLMEE